MRPLAGKAFLRPLQKRSRCASFSLASIRVAPQARSTSAMRPISSSTALALPSLSQSRIAAASRS